MFRHFVSSIENINLPILKQFAMFSSVRLMELMFDMQQYGQPPAEIIKDLAPGLQFDENGMPIMPNMVKLRLFQFPILFQRHYKVNFLIH